MKKNTKGFALVVTIILSTVMLTVVTVASKEMVDEMKNSSRLDNSLIAYYAAEAGVEEALLQYRYDKNKEIGMPPAAEECKQVDNRDIDATGKCVANSFGKTSYYKLKMTSKTSDETKVKVYRDDTYEIPTDNNSPSYATPTWSYEGLSGGGVMKVEVAAYANTDTGEILDKQLLDMSANKAILDMTCSPSCIPGTKKLIRIKPWYVSGPVANNPYIELTIPLGNNSGTTTIESVGYYSNVARKIVAKIDSTSGSILNIFDYTIYSDTPLAK
jgi:Tfp pilus assembly protein PilX